jgi:hypothetical protein
MIVSDESVHCVLERCLPLADAHGPSLYWSVYSVQACAFRCRQSIGGEAYQKWACGSHGSTHIERLNGAVPDDIGPKARGSAADDGEVVNRDALGPQHAALVRALGGVVFKRNGRGPVGRVRAHVARMALVPLPVWRDDAIARGGDVCITRRRRRAVGRLTARRRHPSTGAVRVG